MNVCPNCGLAHDTTACPSIMERDIRRPHKCPVCDGAGKVSRPPHVAGDIPTWSDSGTGPYECQSCNGAGVIWG